MVQLVVPISFWGKRPPFMRNEHLLTLSGKAVCRSVWNMDKAKTPAIWRWRYPVLSRAYKSLDHPKHRGSAALYHEGPSGIQMGLYSHWQSSDGSRCLVDHADLCLVRAL